MEDVIDDISAEISKKLRENYSTYRKHLRSSKFYQLFPDDNDNLFMKNMIDFDSYFFITYGLRS